MSYTFSNLKNVYKREQNIQAASYQHILLLPNDILQKIQSFLDYNNKVKFLYTILSSKESSEFDSSVRQLTKKNYLTSPLLYSFHNSITYVKMFRDIIWGDNIPSNEEFKETFDLILSGNVSIEKKLENTFDIIKEIYEYLFASPNKSYTHIIWNNKKIGSRKRYAEYYSSNIFWRNSLYSIKFDKKIGLYTPSSCRSRKYIMHNIYNIPPGWVTTAKKDARTALSLIY